MTLAMLLSDDLLLQIFAPFCVTKHGTLQAICKRLRQLLTSAAFHDVRRQMGFAQRALVFYGGGGCLSGRPNWRRSALLPGAGAWRELARYPGNQGNYTRLALDEVTSLFLGGFDEDLKHEGRIFEYSFKVDKWTVVTHTPQQIDNMATVLSKDGKLYLMGGSLTGSGWLCAEPVAWVFDPTKVTVSSEQLEQSYQNLSAGVITFANAGEEEAFWAARGFERLPDMPYAVACADTCLRGDRLYVIGGLGDDGETWPWPTRRLRPNKREALKWAAAGAYYEDPWECRENVKVSWVQELNLRTRRWRLVTEAPAEDDAQDTSEEQWNGCFGTRDLWNGCFEVTSAMRTALNEVGLCGPCSAAPWEDGTALIGDYARMAFVDASGAISEFKPKIGDQLDSGDRSGPGGQDIGAGLECARLKTIELRADHAHVRRLASKKA